MLDSDLAKKVAKSNRFGLLSYVGLATAFGLATFAGKTIKDAITKTKIAKNESQEA